MQDKPCGKARYMNSLSVNAKYTIGILVWMTVYVAVLMTSIWTIEHQHPTGLWLDILSIAPALPVGATIVVFHRYIAKVDEYVRAVVVKRFVTATGATLFICTAIGFLENGTGKTIMPLYLVYPTFWMCFAAACVIHRKAT